MIAKTKSYKYKLHELFVQKFGRERANAKMVFANLYKYSLRTIERDFARTTEQGPIPTTRLDNYAEFLGVNRDELKYAR